MPDTISAEAMAESTAETLGALLRKPDVRDAVVHHGSSDQVWTTVVAAGWGEVLLAEPHGGLGLDVDVLGAVLTVAGRFLVPGPVLPHTVVLPLIANAAEDTARKIVTDPSNVRARIAFADVAAANHADDRAPVLDEGSLRGTVRLVRDGGDADRFVVVAQRGSELALVLVPATAPGVTVDRQEGLDVAARYATLHFDDVSELSVLVPAATGLVNRIRDTWRLMLACRLAGASRHLLDAAVAYAKERRQFGKPIGSFQAVQHLLADMAADVLALEALCADTVEAVTARPERLPLEAAVAKAAAARTARSVGEGALQVHGGIAFTREHDVHRWFLSALSMQGEYGDEADLAASVGRLLLGGGEAPWS
ncbi:acyl-CoA dehydrogenase family protein [Pseudonocardia halophobica]|uniref:Acyl-CoA dehydrogenase n=1 Tax=Pseudonocardia halophobica TaxID=29401 RepID=A0A9W6KYP3_9PSEU|nr:acyl-CoA dehydrogenase family protein [Pseudonocardia halophobica]GLL09753.1 acyl-CoA dehydrogenase [Pseudonocardia halophobica]